MSKFTTRIELHEADWSDYILLHAQMKRQGFSQTISSGDGGVYQLPPAEYNYVGDATNDQVLIRAKAAAGAVKRSFAVLVTESERRTWWNLEQVR